VISDRPLHSTQKVRVVARQGLVLEVSTIDDAGKGE